MHDVVQFDVRGDYNSVLHHLGYNPDQVVHLFRLFDHGNHDGQIVRQVKPSALMGMPLGAVAQYAAIDGRSREIHHAELFYDRFVERLILTFVRFPEVDTHQLCRRVDDFLGAFRFRLPRLRVFGDGLHHRQVLNCNQPIGNHVVQSGEQLIHSFCRLDELDANGAVFRNVLRLWVVELLMRAEPTGRAKERGSRYVLMTQEAKNRGPERFHVGPRVLIQVNCDLLSVAFREHEVEPPSGTQYRFLYGAAVLERRQEREICLEASGEATVQSENDRQAGNAECGQLATHEVLSL